MNSRILLLTLSLSLCFLGCRTQDGADLAGTTRHLDSLYENHQYFQLRDTLQTGHLQLKKIKELLLKAKLHSVFNEREASNALIDQLFSEMSDELSDTERIELLETRITNSVFLYNYAEALKATREVLAYEVLPQDKKKEHQNVLAIYEALKNTPAQTVQLEQSELPITKDMAGLSRIPARINNTLQEVVFDTGANFSVITDSLALRSGIEITGKTFKVKAITGGEVDSRIGVADSLQLGNTLLRNVVFLVFPQESLSFPEANYSIDAILGFPVINALGEVMLVKEEKFVVTASSSEKSYQNLALDFLTPVVEVREDGSSLTFSFDTGANSTAFYEPYYSLRKDRILSQGIKDSLRFGGAGGVTKVPVYKVPFSGKIGESHFTLDSAAVQINDKRDYPGIFGNLGQDVLSQFDTLLIDFRQMQFIVK